MVNNIRTIDMGPVKFKMELGWMFGDMDGLISFIFGDYGTFRVPRNVWTLLWTLKFILDALYNMESGTKLVVLVWMLESLKLNCLDMFSGNRWFGIWFAPGHVWQGLINGLELIWTWNGCWTLGILVWDKMTDGQHLFGLFVGWNVGWFVELGEFDGNPLLNVRWNVCRFKEGELDGTPLFLMLDWMWSWNKSGELRGESELDCNSPLLLNSLKMSKSDLVFKHGGDFGIWKKRMVSVWAESNLFEMTGNIDDWAVGHAKITKALTKEDIVVIWRKEQTKALALLWRYLDASVIHKIGDVETAKEAIKKMEEIYERKGGITIIYLMYKLWNLKMDGNKVEKYIEEFDETFNSLESHGHKMPEVEKAMIMMCGVPDGWSGWRNQLFQRVGYDKLTREEVKVALRDEEMGIRLSSERRKNGKEEEENYAQEKAMIARSSDGRGGGAGRFGLVCESCGRRGHDADNCSTQCFGCKKFGHLRSNCPNNSGRGGGRVHEMSAIGIVHEMAI